MKTLPFRIGLPLIAATGVLRADLPFQQQVSFTPGASGTWNVDWMGEANRTYFIEWTGDLVHWNYYPLMDFGEGVKSFGINPNYEPKHFIRLHYLQDSNVTTLQQARDADFDSDGFRNAVEVELLRSDPFIGNIVEGDVDGDGIPDAWATTFTAYLTLLGIPVTGIDPLADYDGDGLNNAEEAAAGTNPFLMDTDGDGIPDGADPEPLVAQTTPAEVGFRVLTVME